MAPMRKSFLLSSWLFGFANSLSAPLLGLYVYVNSSLEQTLEFLFMSSAFILTGYITVGYLVAFRNNAATYMGLGIWLHVAFYSSLLALGVRVVDVLPFIAALYGLAQGFYWCGWDVVFYNVVDKLQFFNKSFYLGLVTNFASPAIYGAVLSAFRNSGYGLLFLMTAALLVLAIFLVEDARINAKVDVKNAVFVIKNDKGMYKYTATALALVGGANYVLGNLNTILLYQVTKSYRYFALTNYLLTAASAASVYVLRDRLVHKIGPRRLVVSSSILLSLSGASLLLGLPLIYLTAYYVASPLIYPIVDVYTWNAMDKRRLMDYLVNRQIMLNGGRMLLSLSEILMASSVGGGAALGLSVILTASLIFARAGPLRKLAPLR